MAWLDRLLGRDPPSPGVVTARSIAFDKTGLRATSRTTNRIEWRDADGDTVVVEVDHNPTDGWPVVGGLEALRAHCRRQAAPPGHGIVSVDVVEVSGVSCARVVTKHERLPTYVYEGALVVPLRDARATLTMSASEHGMTGGREVMVTMQLFSSGVLRPPPPSPTGGPQRLAGWAFDPYDAAYDESALCSLADDERLDELLPQHPLSKVREWLRQVAETVAIAPEARPNRDLPAVPSPPSDNRAVGRVPSTAIARLYFLADRHEGAARHLEASIPMRDGEPAVADAETASTLLLLGVLREGHNEWVGAAWAYSRALAMSRSVRGELDMETLRAAANLGRLYVQMDRVEDARPLLERVAPIFEERGEHTDAGVSLNDLGLIKRAGGEHQDARSYFERALRHFEQAEAKSGKLISDRAVVLTNLASVFDALGDRQRAKAARSGAEAVRQRARAAQARPAPHAR